MRNWWIRRFCRVSFVMAGLPFLWTVMFFLSRASQRLSRLLFFLTAACAPLRIDLPILCDIFPHHEFSTSVLPRVSLSLSLFCFFFFCLPFCLGRSGVPFFCLSGFLLIRVFSLIPSPFLRPYDLFLHPPRVLFPFSRVQAGFPFLTNPHRPPPQTSLPPLLLRCSQPVTSFPL